MTITKAFYIFYCTTDIVNNNLDPIVLKISSVTYWLKLILSSFGTSSSYLLLLKYYLPEGQDNKIFLSWNETKGAKTDAHNFKQRLCVR